MPYSRSPNGDTTQVPWIWTAILNALEWLISGGVTVDPSTLATQTTLAALLAAATPHILKEEVVTLPTASATLISLLAGTAFQAGVKTVTLLPLANIGLNVGADAVITAPLHAAGGHYSVACLADTDLHIIADAAAACRVTQEG